MKKIKVELTSGEEVFIKYSRDNVDLLESEISGSLDYIQELETTENKIITSIDVLSYEVKT